MITHPVVEKEKVNCSICYHTNELVQWLIDHGYTLSVTYVPGLEPYLFTSGGKIYTSSNEWLKTFRKCIYDCMYGITCAGDVEMFKELTSLEDSSDWSKVEDIVERYRNRK
jgi:hypothetical protein